MSTPEFEVDSADWSLLEALSDVVAEFSNPGHLGHTDPANNLISAQGVKHGWCRRPSTTQIEWTQEGVDLLQQARKERKT